jgi:hypothetical protein
MKSAIFWDVTFTARAAPALLSQSIHLPELSLLLFMHHFFF